MIKATKIIKKLMLYVLKIYTFHFFVNILVSTHFQYSKNIDKLSLQQENKNILTQFTENGSTKLTNKTKSS